MQKYIRRKIGCKKEAQCETARMAGSNGSEPEIHLLE
jgi:hypothetical protein